MATDKAQAVNSFLHLLKRLDVEEGYKPTHVIILQTTSPLREQEDIEKCWQLMQESDATTVLTVCPTNPRFYHLSPKNDLILVNGSEKQSTNTQEWEPGFILNGCFVYIVKVEALLKEKVVITKNTKVVVCPKWRSVDLDTPEEWVMGEVLYKNKKKIKANLKIFL